MNGSVGIRPGREVYMRVRSLLVASTVALAACTTAPSSRPAEPVSDRPSDVLLLGTAVGPLAVTARTGSVVFEEAGAVAAPDGSVVYASSADGVGTSLRAIDAATGEILGRTDLNADLAVRVASESGHAVAMTEPLRSEQGRWIAAPTSTTTIVVADPLGETAPRTYALTGNFEPEAFSVDDGQLFLLQYLPAHAPVVYRVTTLDLASGDVRPVFGPYKAPAERMPGTRLEQVWPPDGRQLYTLYTSDRPGFAPHDAPVPRNAVVSFVHVLSLEEGWAHCVELPGAFWGQPASAEAMTASPDGRTLYIVDAEKGLVTTLDASSLDVSGPYHVSLPAPGGRTSATTSADGRTLFVGTAGDGGKVAAIDTRTFSLAGSWSVGGGVSGLGLSTDGSRLYVALDDRVDILDPTSGRDLGSVSLTTPAPIVQVTALAG